MQNATIDFNDVPFHENDSCHKMSTEESASSFVNTTSTDIEHLWECVQESHHQRFGNTVMRFVSSHSELRGQTNNNIAFYSSAAPFMSDESTNLEDENFFIQDIHNSICLGDELFTNGLNSPYYNLSAIEI